ncbi:hypothetical protein ELQ87_25795 [Streptomyces griseoviridis]|uniref:Uncharacterized protein n=1 Tax=Streptomyces griseoviridis TaxID=45398 RepID=A0A3S9ZHP6_STRGD|nr:hypothetical protein [Streptomyces griseoviridis]AZS87261.1 hypothetical protein ELQ87_25795 [Streptomyces griseoviridis]QCN85888.1 hypothetical protein DDJ31_13470 [Streptomyces griseoviridis]
MLESPSVVLQTTKNVACKTTQRRPAAETHRIDAWNHLKSPGVIDPDAWLGELSKIPRLLEHSGTLAEVSEKYDRILDLIEFGVLEDLGETDLLAALLVQRALRDKLQIDEPRLIAAARRKNITWSRLAPALEVGSRQSAERRYLQLRHDMDGIIGHSLTQGDRVEAARTQRNRRAEQHWALQHDAEITVVGQRLAALTDLQQRADSCPKVARANQVAIIHARRDGASDPAPLRTPWPEKLIETVAAQKAHQEAEAAARELAANPCQAPPVPAPAPLTPVRYARLIHQMFSLVGYAIDSDNVSLSDHQDLVDAIRELYERAGPNAPRAPQDY